LARGIAPTRTINIVGAILSRLKFLRAKTLASNMVAPVFLWPGNFRFRVLGKNLNNVIFYKSIT
ncbi:MAG: hypothetical protein DRR19_27300, partial [Candidatus Parabeggiatoa sp. nov. 1]